MTARAELGGGEWTEDPFVDGLAYYLPLGRWSIEGGPMLRVMAIRVRRDGEIIESFSDALADDLDHLCRLNGEHIPRIVELPGLPGEWCVYAIGY